MNYISIIVNTVIICVFVISLVVGYKKGFAETSSNFVISILSMILAYIFKNPVSVSMYTNLPFFNLDGMFKGVSIINVLIYELIAYLLLFLVFNVLLAFLFNLTNIAKIVFSLLVRIRIPNRLFGAIFCFLQVYLFMYFVSFIVLFFCNISNYTFLDDTLVNKIYKTPILHETLEPVYNTLSDITKLVDKYDSVNTKEEFNQESIKILLKYDVISEDNVRLLVDKKKLDIDNVDELFN